MRLDPVIAKSNHCISPGMLHQPGTLIIVPWKKYFFTSGTLRGEAALRRGFDERLSLPATAKTCDGAPDGRATHKGALMRTAHCK